MVFAWTLLYALYAPAIHLPWMEAPYLEKQRPCFSGSKRKR